MCLLNIALHKILKMLWCYEIRNGGFRINAPVFNGTSKFAVFKCCLWHLAKKSAHLALWEFRCFAVCRYSRFLWPVNTWDGCFAPSSHCHHSSRASVTTNSSRSPVSLLGLVGDRCLEEKAHGWFFCSFFICWDSTAPALVSEALTSTMSCR